MKTTETIYVKTRKEWRKWLEKNHNTFKEIWLIYYKKHTGKPRISYNDAVEEALCFGWIDSTIKRVNEEYYVQRFTPRKIKSEWSLLNIIRIKKMVALGAVKDAGMETIKHIDLDKSEQLKTKEKNQTVEIPAYITTIFKSKTTALVNFKRLPISEKLLYVRWIEDVKKNRPEIIVLRKCLVCWKKV